MRYDLIVLGHDHRGRTAALAAGKRGKRVALIESGDDEIPSTRLLREAAESLSNDSLTERSNSGSTVRRQQTMQRLWDLSTELARNERSTVSKELALNGVDCFEGQPSFIGPNEIEVASRSQTTQRLTGDILLVGVGTNPVRPNWVPFDGQTFVDSDELLALPRLPKSMIVVGADLAALESAMFLAVLGTRVVFVDQQPRLLESWDRELIHRFRRRLEKAGVRFRLGRCIQAIEKTPDGRALVQLERGKRLLAERVLYTHSRCGNTSSLNLTAAGLVPDEQGRLWCNSQRQTWVRHIFGIGDVIGFPPHAAVALDLHHQLIDELLATHTTIRPQNARGLSGIPELAMVGATEEQLRHDLVAYESGVAEFSERSPGSTSRMSKGFLKLLFHRESLELLGVHCLCKSATSLIALGETVMSLGGTIESFRDHDMVNLSQSARYRDAAEDGLARVSADSPTAARSRHQSSRFRRSRSKNRRLLLSPR